MHRSRLATVVIDCGEGEYERGTAFWGAALGKTLMPRNERFSSLKGAW